MFQDENVQNITARVDSAPKPKFLTVNHDNHLIEVPFVSTTRSLPPDAIGEVATKPVHPKPDRFPADNHATFNQEIFDVSSTQGKTMIRLNGIGDDFSRETKPFQAQHIRRCFHESHLCQPHSANNLAMPFAPLAIAQFNEVITSEAKRFNIPVLPLPDVCTEEEDFSTFSPIEPSTQGGQKIVDTIVKMTLG